MRATPAIATTLMATVAISQAQNTASDQENGSSGRSGGSKDQSSQSTGTPFRMAKTRTIDAVPSSQTPELSDGLRTCEANTSDLVFWFAGHRKHPNHPRTKLDRTAGTGKGPTTS
jgi:hypothetical protein